MIYVIGSGPAGVSCAAALLKRGCAVTMLDAGVSLEAEKAHLVSSLKARWDDALLPQLKNDLNAANPIKNIFNSSYPYANAQDFYAIHADKEVGCMSSLAKGGLSNVWGAFIERYTQHDLRDWPITLSALQPYYDAVFDFLPRATLSVSGVNAENTYQASKQAQYILKQLTREQTALHAEGISFGSAELAVQFSDANKNLCRYCGYCQHGCPLDLIYSARHTLQTLLQNRHFTYLGNVVVQNIIEQDDHILIQATQRLTKEGLEFKAEQLFLACGALSSTALVAKATHWEKEIKFLDSSHFMLPALLSQSVKNVHQEALHTLCQLYLKLRHPDLNAQPINVQIYTYMDYYPTQFKNSFGKLYPLLAPFLQRLCARLVVIQGHLHSEDSHQFSMQLKENDLFLKAKFNSKTPLIYQSISQHLKKNKRLLGFNVLNPLMKKTKIGRSFHYGGSMPMSAHPQPMQTDILGRLHGFKRWHIVDSSVFPSIPAGSCTPTVMANAYRIGMECDIHGKN